MTHTNSHHPHVNHRPVLPSDLAELTDLALAPFFERRGTALLVISGILLLLGVVGVILRISGGFENRAAWGYYAAIFAFVLSTAQAAPLLSVATRFTKGFWRKPLVRAAELFTVSGILNLFLLIPLLFVIPPVEGRRSFWCAKFEGVACVGPWPMAPHLWILVGMVALVICGLGLLYCSARPDIAMAQDRQGKERGGVAGSWYGSTKQWKLLTDGVTYFGAFYLIILMGTHFLVSTEMAISLVPGWRDPIFPAFHGISAIQAGLATLIITLGLLRAFGGYKQFLALDQFWNPAKLLLSFSLLWFYFWWSGFIIFWYGRTPPEVGVLTTTMFGPYLYPFILAFFCHFVIPLLLLMWNPIRVSIKGPIIASSVILFGSLMDRVRIYAGAFGVEDLTAHFVQHAPPTRLPDLADALVLVGAIGGTCFLYLLAMRIIPAVALWELKEGALLTRTRTLIRSHVLVIGKPQ